MKSGLAHFSTRFLYQEYKKRIDPYEVLSYYGVDNSHERTANDGTTEVVHSCLLDRVEPHHAHGDSNPSASLNVDHKLFICYSYWGGDIFQLLMKMEQKETLPELVPFLQQFLSESRDDSKDRFKEEIEKIFAKEEIQLFDPPSYSEMILKPWLVSHPYLRENRGVSLEASSKLKIGYDPDANRLVFPHFWEGKLVGFQKRSIPQGPYWPATLPDKFGNLPKYKNSIAFPKTQTIYNYDSVRQAKYSSVIVVESPMSVARAYSLGIENIVATFGAKISQTQIDLLKEFDELYIWMDNDEDRAGQKAEELLVRSLYRQTRVWRVPADWKKDLGDAESREEVDAKLASADPAVLVLGEYDRWKRYQL